MENSEYRAEIAALAENDAPIHPARLTFRRCGYVPYIGGKHLATALGVSLTELGNLLPICGANGIWVCEYDALWNDLIYLARTNYPGAARLWLALYGRDCWGEQ